MTTKAQAFAEVLIKRHQEVCRTREKHTAESVDNIDIYTCFITYVELCREAKVGAPIGASLFLAEIYAKCVANGWPPLNSLVVNQKTHEPGKQYSGKSWKREIKECIAFPGYPPISDPKWN